MAGAIIYSVWALLVGLWWAQSGPESAPQQAAVAAQALVLVVIPYTITATLQRASSKIRDVRGDKVAPDNS